MSTMTGISGYIQTFVMPIVLLGIIYYVPVYFQACKGATPIGAGVDQLGLALLLAPSGMVSGILVKKTQKYRPQLWISWVLLTIGTGLLSTLDERSHKRNAIGFEVIAAVGLGILTTTTYFPVLAPLQVTQNGPALAYFMFLRNFAQVWGVTIGGAILQNELQKHIPSEFLLQFPQGTAVAYATIPLIPTLSEPLRDEIRAAFAASLKVVWEVLAGISALGLVTSIFMRGLPLHTAIDKDWILDNSKTDDRDQHELSST
jgi:hypothetical protein